MPKLDDASWHYGGDEFPPELAEECGATHMGMFARWAIERGFWSEFLGPESAISIREVGLGALSARSFILERCDGKLLSEMLVAEAATFAEKYYPKKYLAAYKASVAHGLKSDYLVAESEENYRTIAQTLDSALYAWRKKPKWKFW